jgi:hypothetical protein
VGRAQVIRRQLEQVEGLPRQPDDLDENATRELVDDGPDRAGRPATEVSVELNDVVGVGSQSVSSPRRNRDTELLADRPRRMCVDLAVTRHSRLLPRAHPHVVAPAVSFKARVMLPKPTLQFPPLHCVRLSDADAATAAEAILKAAGRILNAAREHFDLRAQPRERILQAALRVEEIIERVDHIRARLVVRAALGDRARKLEDPRSDPAILRLLEADREMLDILAVR